MLKRCVRKKRNKCQLEQTKYLCENESCNDSKVQLQGMCYPRQKLEVQHLESIVETNGEHSGDVSKKNLSCFKQVEKSLRSNT